MSRFRVIWLGLACTGLISAVTLLPRSAVSADGGVTDIAEAGPDYALQGEYVGEFEFEGQASRVGLQVIALGDGKFHGVGYLGGLPGDGWDGVTKLEADGEVQDGVLVFDTGDGRATIEDGRVLVETNDGTELGTMERTERKSPTLGKPPTEDAIVLFDGTTSENFEGGRIIEDKLLGVGCKSKQKFGDFQLHMEFRTPFMPEARSQGRGNSGVYLQDRYEVQILDSFGLAGLHNECGGIYSLHDPQVNMCFPPLVWQTYDIDFTAPRFDDEGNKTASARVTVRHNGVVVHEDYEVTEITPGGQPEGPEPGPIMLQNHGNPVAFRNIWVIPKAGDE